MKYKDIIAEGLKSEDDANLDEAAKIPNKQPKANVSISTSLMDDPDWGGYFGKQEHFRSNYKEIKADVTNVKPGKPKHHGSGIKDARLLGQVKTKFTKASREVWAFYNADTGEQAGWQASPK